MNHATIHEVKGPESGAVYLKSIVPSELSVCNKAESFLQSGFWGSFKAHFGWNVRAFTVDWGFGGERPLLVIRRRLAFGFCFAYVPWGPEFPEGFPDDGAARNTALLELARSLCPLMPDNVAFIRFDPPWYTEGPGTPAPVLSEPFSPAGADVQPPDTVLLDLTQPEKALLGGMKGKWRYNVGLAGKRGVTVRRGGSGADLERFYQLLTETARRDGIALHSLGYYKTLFTHCAGYLDQGQEAALYLAEHEGEVLAGIVVLFRGAQAVYLYGASSDRKRNLMAPYALQWSAIQDAKARGCRVYDLFGIPPRDDPGHPMAGLYRFKTGFGGRIIHRPGSWDYAYRPLVKALFVLAEGLRKKLRTFRSRRSHKEARNMKR
ncbi:MAG: peptidoglycan bridge formation glycyltransferase FemA/FemB family protein [Spirochaetaceae bacterium]|nr:peptidoglycan bridge formation glycyltransferase FemA/FemB family protein [Spirochaetaceae bacterium]